MGERYKPEAYKKNKSTFEKIVFSAPEYIFYETRLGEWIVLQLEKMMMSLNQFSIENIPKPSNTWERHLIEIMTDIITKLLEWMNYYIEKREREILRKMKK